MLIKNKKASQQERKRLSYQWKHMDAKQKLVYKALNRGEINDNNRQEIPFADVHHKVLRQFGGLNRTTNLILMNMGQHHFIHVLVEKQIQMLLEYILLPDLPEDRYFMGFEEATELLFEYELKYNQHIKDGR